VTSHSIRDIGTHHLAIPNSLHRHPSPPNPLTPTHHAPIATATLHIAAAGPAREARATRARGRIAGRRGAGRLSACQRASDNSTLHYMQSGCSETKGHREISISCMRGPRSAGKSESRIENQGQATSIRRKEPGATAIQDERRRDLLIAESADDVIFEQAEGCSSRNYKDHNENDLTYRRQSIHTQHTYIDPHRLLGIGIGTTLKLPPLAFLRDPCRLRNLQRATTGPAPEELQ
jgi:hypothetical protein